ncbi:HPr family phosphocarrier protein, partial [Bacillus subtilis]|nr:HPr family phosphocarrier protein [Bacillus subtilis]
ATNGLETRADVEFGREVKGVTSEINVNTNGKRGREKSMFKMQELGRRKGNVGTCGEEGEDEQKAVEHLVKLMAELE